MDGDIRSADETMLFAQEELQCPHCEGFKLHDGFADKLRELRETFDRPMHVNSCCRCEEHSGEVGGHPHSLHVFDKPYWPTNGTIAIDIRTSGLPPEYRIALHALAWNLGWSIGNGSTFLHLDRRIDLKIDALKQTEFYYHE